MSTHENKYKNLHCWASKYLLYLRKILTQVQFVATDKYFENLRKIRRITHLNHQNKSIIWNVYKHDGQVYSLSPMVIGNRKKIWLVPSHEQSTRVWQRSKYIRALLKILKRVDRIQIFVRYENFFHMGKFLPAGCPTSVRKITLALSRYTWIWLRSYHKPPSWAFSILFDIRILY